MTRKQVCHFEKETLVIWEKETLVINSIKKECDITLQYKNLAKVISQLLLDFDQSYFSIAKWCHKNLIISEKAGRTRKICCTCLKNICYIIWKIESRLHQITHECTAKMISQIVWMSQKMLKIVTPVYTPTLSHQEPVAQ